MEYNKKKDNEKYFCIEGHFSQFLLGKRIEIQQGKSYESVFMEPLGMMN